MKIKYVDDENFIVYINKYYYKYDKNTIRECITKALKRIKKIYNINLYLTFNIDCYICDNYGIILNIKTDKDPFYKYLSKTNTNIKYYYNSIFLFEVEDYFLKDKIKCNVYIYNKKYYLELKEDYSLICEHIIDIVFGEKYKIIKNV